MDSKNDNDEKIVLLPAVQGFTSNLHWTTLKALGKMLEGDTRAAALSYAFIDSDTDNDGNPVRMFDEAKLEAFEAGAKWQKGRDKGDHITKTVEWLYKQLSEGHMECGNMAKFICDFEKEVGGKL